MLAIILEPVIVQVGWLGIQRIGYYGAPRRRPFAVLLHAAATRGGPGAPESSGAEAADSSARGKRPDDDDGDDNDNR